MKKLAIAWGILIMLGIVFNDPGFLWLLIILPAMFTLLAGWTILILRIAHKLTS